VPALALIGLPILAIVLVNPLGEFPLNDDWSYSLAVKHFADTWEIRLSDWGAMSQVWQIVYAGLYSKIFGFSFTGLRLLTCMIALLTNVVLYRIFLRFNRDRFLALAGVALVFFNPLYFNMVMSFMTEVHFFFWFALSILAFIKAGEAPDGVLDARHLWLASALASLAFLVRQHGLLVPCAFLGVQLLFCLCKGQWRKRFFKSILPTMMLPVLVYLGFSYWTRFVHGVSPSFNRKLDLLEQFGWEQICLVLWPSLTYLGGFVLPLATVFFIPWITRRTRSQQISVIAWLWFGLVACLFWCSQIPAPSVAPYGEHHRNIMPFVGNIFYDFGLGPLTLTDSYLGPPSETVWPFLWRIITLVTCGAFLLLFPLGKRMVHDGAWRRPERLFILVLLLALISLEILISPRGDGGIFDRHMVNYLLPGLALVLGILSDTKLLVVRFRRGLVITLIAIPAYLGVAGTHDYLSWNRARWQGLTFLMQERAVQPARIDGGFEFNGWYTSSCYPRQNGIVNLPFQRPWWVVQDDYRIFWSRRTMDDEHFTAILDLPWNSWLELRGKDIVVAVRRDRTCSLSEPEQLLEDSRPDLVDGGIIQP